MTRIPTKSEILDWIRDNPDNASKRDVAKAFGLKGAARIELKRVLREQQADGQIVRDRKNLRDPDVLPPVSVLRVIGPDSAGDLFAEPADWQGEGATPRILLHLKSSDPALGPGDRALVRLTEVTSEDHSHEGRLIRRIGTGPRTVLGIYRQGPDTGRLLPIDKKSGQEWIIRSGDRAGAKDGELVEAEQSGPKGRLGLPSARITARLGDPGAPRAVSLIAIHQHGIPDHFPAEVLAEADAAKQASLKGREDLRDLPLLTIDPADARDHDDAVCALPDGDGFKVWVAIADVAHYVTPGSALDHEARKRGNSTYFPDRVVPMLPDALSGDLCSLHEDVDRPCLAVEMRLGADGEKLSHRFLRGMMRSRASLTYAQAQAVDDGASDLDAEMQDSLHHLFAAYRAKLKERARRAPLNLELPERQIVLDEDGTVASIAFRDRLDAHKLIEEFMVLANVAVAETLESKRQPFVYRVHEEPSPEKLEALRTVVETAGLSLPKGQVLRTSQLNRLLDAAAGLEDAELINLTVLRSMTQAYYGARNFGHFGLALKRYAHFTSPIRRYADLIVHRALVSAHGWDKDGLSPADIERLDDTAEQISQTERRSMLAERDTTDRYLAAYLADRVGNEFEGRVSGIARFGLFVRLEETGADGLIPISALGREYFHYDRDSQTLTGETTRRVIGIGMRATVRLAEAEASTGGLLFDLLALDGQKLAGPARGKDRKGGPRRKAGRAKIARSKAKRRAKRS